MNYHNEHHIITMVPYYRLPELNELIKHELPASDSSIYAAFRRHIPVLLPQLRNREVVIVPKLPEGVTPYRKKVERRLIHSQYEPALIA